MTMMDPPPGEYPVSIVRATPELLVVAVPEAADNKTAGALATILKLIEIPASGRSMVTILVIEPEEQGTNQPSPARRVWVVDA